MKRIVLVFLLVARFGWGNVIYTNTPGEYFAVSTNNMGRFVFITLTLLSDVVTMTVNAPPLTPLVSRAIQAGGIENIVVTPVSLTQTLAEIQESGSISANVVLTVNSNAAVSPPGNYQVALSALYQVLNTNIYSPEYFTLQMVPITSGTTGIPFFDIYFGKTVSVKWIQPPQGLFVAQTWSTNQIIEPPTATSPMKLTFTVQVPYSTFINSSNNLQNGTYFASLFLVMSPPTSTAGLNAAQAASLQKLINNGNQIASSSNTTNPPTSAQLVVINANVAYLEKLIAAVLAATPAS